MLLSLAMYVHHIDPFAVQFPKGFPLEGIRWYGLSYLAGFIVGYLLIRRVVKVGISTLKPAEVADMVVAIAIGVVVGGRLGYVVFYDPALFGFTNHFPYWGVLAINDGGMASHGGMIGAILASGYYAWRHHHRWTHVLDLAAFGTPIGLFFGRLANFVNGELYGRACSATLPWAMKFPREIYTWINKPAKLRDLIPIADLISAKQNATLANIDQYIPRIVAQAEAGNQKVLQALAPFLTPRHPSQLYEALLEGVLLFTVLVIAWAKPRKPMVIAGWFCTVYAMVRIVAEEFRQPDFGIGYQWLGLTRGQWLSIPLLAAGVALIIIFSRRKAPLMGGWRKHSAAAPSPSGRGLG